MLIGVVLIAKPTHLNLKNVERLLAIHRRFTGRTPATTRRNRGCLTVTENQKVNDMWELFFDMFGICVFAGILLAVGLDSRGS